MNKVKVLLSSVALVALVAGAFASQARLSNVVYTPGANPAICDAPLFTRTFVPDPKGPHSATLIKGAACQPGTIVVLPND
ncbi:hypothetical protein [Chitinophaga eiseniae]|uniref:hypothetical protein n=1 Tax=Chitinophaga eiseniae TaxID=634771 RepID=UPI00117894FC|nr:hypothetical protein [Chitinophaga eiseniae]